jgi:anti-sigma factor RsiW
MPEDTWQPKLDLYLDSVLSAEEMRDMDAHLRGCSTCAGDALSRLQLKRATRVAGKRYTPSAEFRRRVEQQVTARRRPARRWAWMPALAMAAVMLVAALVATGRWYERSRSQQLLSELAVLHVADLASTTPVDIVSSDRHTVKPWFQGKLPFTFDLPELQATGFTLVGGRLAYLHHEPGAHLLYNVGAHHISVFIFRDRPEIERAFPKHESSGVLSFHVESWATNGLRYYVFGDASPQAIEELSRLLKVAAS